MAALFCEGEQSEPNFLRAWCRHQQINHRQLQIEAGNRRTAPHQVLERALKYRSEYEQDFIAAIVDGDNAETDYQQLGAKGARNDVLLVVSTPCIEAWYLRQFSDAPCPPASKDATKQLCKQHWTGYCKSTTELEPILQRQPYKPIVAPKNCIDMTQLITLLSEKFAKE